MAWNLATAKKYLGLEGDDTKDEMIVERMAYTQQSIETVLGRGILRERQTVKFVCHRPSATVQLPRAPITEVFTINGGEAPADMQIHHDVGLICYPTFAGEQTLEVDYEGGYDPIPLDLENCMWQAFMTAWGQIDQTTGGPPADGSSGIIEGSGEVKSMTVFDAFKVDYDVGSTATGGTDTGTISTSDWGWLAPWGTVLGFYRWGPSGAEMGIA